MSINQARKDHQPRTIFPYIKFYRFLLDPLFNLLAGPNLSYFSLGIDSDGVVTEWLDAAAIVHLDEWLFAGEGDQLSDVREKQSICLFFHRV